MTQTLKSDAEKRLNISRDTELLQSFVRINVDDDSTYDDKHHHRQTSEHQKKEETGESEKRTRQAPLSPETSRKLSKQLTQEGGKSDSGKRKKRKTVPRQEELYCDKDRAAAVNLGSKDIKHSLRLKRKQDRSKNLHIPEEAEPGTFLALGNYEMCRGDLQIAVDFMSKALELNPSEKNSLVARSKCYILMGQPENALKDAETALLVDKGFIKAIYQKAEALYFLGDFEHSLMYFHRGLHIRPDHEGFKLENFLKQKPSENFFICYHIFPEVIIPDYLNNQGNQVNLIKNPDCQASDIYRGGAVPFIIVYSDKNNKRRIKIVIAIKKKINYSVHKAQKAIENAIGNSFHAIIKTSKSPSKTSATPTTATAAAVTKPTPNSKGSSSRQSPECNNTNRANSSMAKSSQRTTPFGFGRAKSSKQSRLLRELGADKEYLDNLMHNPDIKCKYKENDTTIEKCIKETVDYLNARQEFWRQQLPAKLK